MIFYVGDEISEFYGGSGHEFKDRPRPFLQIIKKLKLISLQILKPCLRSSAWIEQKISNFLVRGSNPFAGTINPPVGGSIPSPDTMSLYLYSFSIIFALT